MAIVCQLLARFSDLPDEYPDKLLFLIKSNVNPKVLFYVYKLLMKLMHCFWPRVSIEHVLLEVLEKEPFVNAAKCIKCIAAYQEPGADFGFDTDVF